MKRLSIQWRVTLWFTLLMTLLAAVENVARVKKENGSGAHIIGIHLEGPYIDSQFRGAQPLWAVAAPSMEEFKEYQEKAEGLIRLITLAGFGIFFASLAALLVFLIQKLLGYTVQGWATLMGSIWLIGGIQLLALGVIGEYVGKTYTEVKHRPRFIIESALLDDSRPAPEDFSRR